jgi:hypothetical protein
MKQELVRMPGTDAHSARQIPSCAGQGSANSLVGTCRQDKEQGAIDRARPAGRSAGRLKVALVGAICAACIGSGRAFTLFNYQLPPGGSLPYFSDVLANPNDHLHWNQTTITYSFDANFNAMFPDPRIKAQVRLALATWANASTIGYSPTYGYDYFDTLEMPAFCDIRSITLHELGHALGLGHPGPASSPGAGAFYTLNFIYVPDGGDPSTETLTKVNTSQAYPATSTEVMYAFFSSGEYRRILTWDELDAYNKVYGNQALTFTEVPSGGNIVFSAWNAAANGLSAGNLAVTFVSGTQGTMASGSVITSAILYFNNHPPTKIGFQTHGNNWTAKNNVFKVHTVKVRTHGTDNTTPDAWWDNNGTPYFFNSGGPPTGVSGAAVGLKNDITWTWTLPGATAATDIPVGTDFHPGLALDVNNWTVANSQCLDISGNFSSTLPLTVADTMDNAVVGSMAAEAAGSSPEAGHQLTFFTPATNALCVQGFSIVASDAPQTTISQLEYADVTGMGLSLSNLNKAGLAQLQTNGLVVTVSNFGTYTLTSNQRFVVVLTDFNSCIPSDVSTNGHFLILNRPDLLKKELFLTWQSANAENTVQNFAMVGDPPAGSRPTLRINRQGPTTNNVILTWDAPSTGFVLQQNTNITVNSWQAVENVPNVVRSATLGVYQNQVSVPATSRQEYYRLYHP